MFWGAFALAFGLGAIVSGGVYVAYLWPAPKFIGPMEATAADSPTRSVAPDSSRNAASGPVP